jgi:FkbM family methyltransferase
MMAWLIMQDKSRYMYPLTEKSVVFDVGGYGGETSFQLNELYHPFILVFEPIKKYYESLRGRFEKNINIQVLPFGLGGYTRETVFQVDNGGSSLFSRNIPNTSCYGRPSCNKPTEQVKIKNIVEFMKESNIQKIDLLCLNIEGMEYELLDELIRTDAVKQIENIQVQFHRVVEDYKWRRYEITQRLRRTHKRTYNFPFIFENWRIKK